jgi:hypothetical protein
MGHGCEITAPPFITQMNVGLTNATTDPNDTMTSLTQCERDRPTDKTGSANQQDVHERLRASAELEFTTSIEKSKYLRGLPMNHSQRFANGMMSGTSGSVLSAIALIVCGWTTRGRPAGPLNGPSQWFWGRPAADVRHANVRHTVVGYGVHHATSIFWGVIHENLFPRVPNEPIGPTLAKAATTAALACFVDYGITPRRLQPGFDRQLSRPAIAHVYIAFAIGLAIARIASRPRS